MSKRAWMLIAAVLTGGILFQIYDPSHGEHHVPEAAAGHDPGTHAGVHGARSEEDRGDPGSRTVVLAVTGMT